MSALQPACDVAAKSCFPGELFMSKYLYVLVLALSLSGPSQAQNPRVWFDLEQGPIILELDAANAPVTTENFLDYVDAGFYNGIIFHRIVDEFVLQAGGYNKDFFFQSPILPAIESERNNGLSNEPGTIAMALAGSNPDSAQSQFYINTVNNDFLDDDFTVFGRVVFGQSVIDELEKLRTGTRFINGANMGNVPMSPPLIRRAARVADGSFPIMPQHVGSWFDANNSGVGFNIEIARDIESDDGARLVVYWYDFRNGEPFWLLGVGAYVYGASEISLDLISWDGVTGEVDFQTPPPGDSFVSVGSLTVRFHDCASGSFDYQVDALGSGSIDVTRPTLPEGSRCEGL
jgi:peptidyl-prolyl cis-trans isomerase A (cyclophilin A)